MTVRAVIPYLAVNDGAGALAFYTEAFGAEVSYIVTDDSDKIGHAEFLIGPNRFYLSDEFPETGVTSPTTAGATTCTTYLDVEDMASMYDQALQAGATSLSEPGDQPHGARQATIVDPFGHRWMLSQTTRLMTVAEYVTDLTGGGWATVAGPGAAASDALTARENAPTSSTSPNGNIWAALNYDDALAGIEFLVSVFGFERQIVVPDQSDPSVVIHSQLKWPEGGVVQAGSANREGNVFSARPTGAESLYVITTDPLQVYERCIAAKADILQELSEPDHDPGGLVFTARDPEGNLWSFGTYAGE